MTKTDREAFEAWRHSRSSALTNPTDWEAWQAATLAERERCAKVCESRIWALDHSGDRYFRPDNAEQCAAAIRKGEQP